MSELLPEGWEHWTLDQKNTFLAELKYNWRNWARPNQLPPPDDWDIWLLLAGRGFGKLGAVDSPVMSRQRVLEGHERPAFRPLGDLRLGDIVYAPDGSETLVIGAYDTEVHDEYLIKFSDGCKVSVSDTHEWVTWTHRDRKQYSRYGNLVEYPDEWWSFKGELKNSHGNVTGSFGPERRTTQQILDTLKIGARGDTNHSIPMAAPLQHSPIETTLDPYLLGVWLGDGSSSQAQITQHESDWPHLEPYFLAEGFEIRTSVGYPQSFRITNGFQGKLTEEGVMSNKHIPERYLYASVEQRLALVQGLMDTDGGLVGYRDKPCSTVEFCTTLPQVADMMMKILWSLGQKPRASWSKAGYKLPDGTHKDCKDRCRIVWTPTMQVFRIPRKRDALDLSGAQGKRNRSRMIVDVVKTGRKVPMRCIKVAHESSLFLIGHELIPTSNTRTGAEYIKERLLAEPGIRVGVIGQTIGAARDICIEGESGLLAVINPELVAKWNRSLGQLRLKNGSQVSTFSGGDPEKLRGFQSHYLWLDELCAFQEASATYDMALMGMRLGRNPRMVITTTPKPTPLIIELVNRSRAEPDRVRMTAGSTFDNAANLAESTLNSLRARYEGTTMGRQELYAELILEEPGALWKRANVDMDRLDAESVKLEDMAEIVVGVDPNMSQATERPTECGIIVAGRGRDGKGYLLHDGSLLRPSPDAWATQVVNLYHRFHANQVVAEVNQGYDLVTHTIHTVDPRVPVKKVYSVRGKSLRAEPIAAYAEQHRIHHVGTYDTLEDQMVQWVPGNPSPDRLDAYVHAFTKLLLGGGLAEFFTADALPRLPGVIR